MKEYTKEEIIKRGNKMNSKHPVDIGLRAYSDGTDTFVAYSLDDVWLLRDELCGNDAYEENEFEAIPMERKLKIMDENHDPESAVEKTVKEWIEFNGRGFLCSTEF